MLGNYAQVIVCYDISDTKVRTKFFNSLKDMGLYNIQNSVFWGYVLPSEKKTIIELCHYICNSTTDKVFVVDACLDQMNKNTLFGYENIHFYKPNANLVI